MIPSLKSTTMSYMVGPKKDMIRLWPLYLISNRSATCCFVFLGFATWFCLIYKPPYNDFFYFRKTHCLHITIFPHVVIYMHCILHLSQHILSLLLMLLWIDLGHNPNQLSRTKIGKIEQILPYLEEASADCPPTAGFITCPTGTAVPVLASWLGLHP